MDKIANERAHYLQLESRKQAMLEQLRTGEAELRQIEKIQQSIKRKHETIMGSILFQFLKNYHPEQYKAIISNYNFKRYVRDNTIRSLFGLVPIPSAPQEIVPETEENQEEKEAAFSPPTQNSEQEPRAEETSSLESENEVETETEAEAEAEAEEETRESDADRAENSIAAEGESENEDQETETSMNLEENSISDSEEDSQPSTVTEDRMYLNVPIYQTGEARFLGLKYDNEKKRFFYTKEDTQTLNIKALNPTWFPHELIWSSIQVEKTA
jgi:type IV secretory pathway VirB10-like protein